MSTNPAKGPPRMRPDRLVIGGFVALILAAAIPPAYSRLLRPRFDRRAAFLGKVAAYHESQSQWEPDAGTDCCVIMTKEQYYYHKAMAANYRWAQQHPWLPMMPDPPMP